ncbi:MAG TPA: hypothetical protein VG028_00670 [Terriglobia bacterium]|nr:hypothetical protein [Terriglobia bacterium]
MKKKRAAEKWASGALGVVCLVLAINLLLRSGVGAGTEKPTPAAEHARAKLRTQPRSGAAPDDLSRYDPEVKLDLLSDLQSRPLPEIERNPFEFPKPKPISPPIGPQLPRPPAPPPPPPPLPLKAIGYSEKENGVKEGIISGEDGIYVVHEGETFAKRYKVSKLTATMVEIYDEATRQTVDMPIAP